MKSLFLLCLFLPLFLASCWKDDTGVVFTLPAKTQAGQNTFGFLLNSRVWTNYGKSCTFIGGCRENLKGMYYRSDGFLEVSADRVLFKDGTWNTSESFGLSVETGFRGPGVYSTLAGDSVWASYRYVEVGKPDEEKYYWTSRERSALRVTITRLDTAAGIISGEFSGKLFRKILTSRDLLLTDSVTVGDGRFDIRYL